MESEILTKAERDHYLVEITRYLHPSLQREALLKLTAALDAIIGDSCFAFVDEPTRILIDGRAQEAFQQWASEYPDCPALADKSRFWVKVELRKTLARSSFHMGLSTELCSLYAGNCSVDLTSHINKWPDHKIRAVYHQAISKEANSDANSIPL
ncbi:hypothetical protein pEaSNUABM52_00039 [Erwinia phage pEp_SNUABM_52]|nr:hypothetical protein pEaSNUABM52_00039 [Erwinia phage pEp_SNUABM_52]